MLNPLATTVICMIGLFLFSCENESPDPPQPQGPIAVKGTVKDEIGNVYPNTLINLTDGNSVMQTKTDEEGKFAFEADLSGDYAVDIVPPLATSLVTSTPVSVNIQRGLTSTVNFNIETQALDANVVIRTIDILGEIKDKDGNIPNSPDELLYARNVFDPPIGLLTAIKAPSGNHVNLAEWESAQGIIRTSCNGNSSDVDLILNGLIPNGTYTLWCNFLNKPKRPGQAVNFSTDLVKIEPLGSGTLNVLTANSTGSVNTRIKHPSCILTEEIALVLVIDYHINGNTFGAAHIPDEEDANHMLVYFQ